MTPDYLWRLAQGFQSPANQQSMLQTNLAIKMLLLRPIFPKRILNRNGRANL